MIKKIKKIAVRAVKKSGLSLLREYNNFDRGTVKLKLHHEILTKADLLSEKIIINEIKKNFSEHRILSEESGKTKNKSVYLWIVDPLDGTTNFSMHNPLWSISVSVCYKNEIILGVVFAPLLGEMYVAEKGIGAMINNKKIRTSNIIKGKVLNTFCHGSKEKYIKKAIQYFNKQKLSGFDCRQLGSAAIELAYVACGRIESITIPGANSWDVVAGILLVREAGGKVTDFFGKEWDLKSENMIASNGKVHNQILKILKM